MNFQEYLKIFEDILTGTNQQAPYYNPHYIEIEYVRLNVSRMNRWMKTMHLNEELVDILKKQ